MQKTIVLIIILLLISFGIYFVAKNPSFFKLRFNFSLNPLPEYPAAPASFNKPSQSPPSSSPPSFPAQKPATITPPEGFTLNQLSPYFQKIRISSIYLWSYSSGGQISLTAGNIQQPINITGFRLKGNRGEIMIPQAVNDYSPSGLAPASDILLSANSRVHLYSNYSAIGQNLRLNKCLGYLNNNLKFSPSLPNNCPSIIESRVHYFSGICQDYIFSLGSCREPDINKLNYFNFDANCLEFLQNINYRTCYHKHRVDADFFSNEWWLWVGSFPFDPYHDRVLLLDRNGLLVDQHIY